MNKKRVCIFTLYPKEGASSNYRILMYINDLEKEFDVKTYSFWNKQYAVKYLTNKKKYAFQIGALLIWGTVKRIVQLIGISRKCDVLIIQKGVFPKMPFTLLNCLKKKGCRIIFDVDDAVFTKQGDNSDAIAMMSDVIVAGNELLGGHYSKINANTVIFPTVDYTPGYQPYIHNTFENKIIGWIGSKSSIENLDIIIGTLNRVMERHPEVRFSFIAGTPDGYDARIHKASFVKWSLDTYKSDMSDFSIGIMPLQDNEFNRGKCGFKLIQYMNLHKPVIASPVGTNEEIVGNCGFIAENEDEWIDAIEKLLFNSEVYNECLKHLDDEFEKKYSYKIVLDKWIKLINEI